MVRIGNYFPCKTWCIRWVWMTCLDRTSNCHAMLWWYNVQGEWRTNNKKNLVNALIQICSWDEWLITSLYCNHTNKSNKALRTPYILDIFVLSPTTSTSTVVGSTPLLIGVLGTCGWGHCYSSQILSRSRLSKVEQNQTYYGAYKVKYYNTN